ncbi:hypothetical protein BLX24_03585 [Arsenicibacter rosenii]|uniref:SH3b domain-containing protein n=1 Tax=Arsenicibacter rosenii TaxID=1750698 RepID=A0A1S2VS51_9BACT|nr:hypothetical protein BLX24_03585 [Arsenicibacter rosenii]
MQAYTLKKILFVFFLPVCLAVKAENFSVIKRADSLFSAGLYNEASALYQSELTKGEVATDGMLLKLAYVAEKNNDVPKLLYFLEMYFDRHPNESILQKMNDIARANGLIGYETDDLNYFYLFYKQYGLYVLLALLALGMYVFGIIVVRIYHKESVPQRYKWVAFVYLVTLFIFVNLPEGYQSGIINRDKVLLRAEPSSAAPVIEIISRGNKINILGSADIWLRVFWNDRLYYIRKDDVWVI